MNFPVLFRDASWLVLYSRGTDKAENLLRSADHTENNSRDSYFAIPLER
jgi:hypothetical protein